MTRPKSSNDIYRRSFSSTHYIVLAVLLFVVGLSACDTHQKQDIDPVPPSPSGDDVHITGKSTKGTEGAYALNRRTRKLTWKRRRDRGDWWGVYARRSYLREDTEYSCKIAVDDGRVSLYPYAWAEDEGFTLIGSGATTTTYADLTFEKEAVPADADRVYCWVYPREQSSFAFTWREREMEEEPALLWPLDGSFEEEHVTLAFGKDWVKSCNGKIKKHTGVDIRTDVGDPVFASEAGVVKHYTRSSQWAEGLAVENYDGERTLVYWHINTNLKRGAKVKRGQKVGNIAAIYNKKGQLIDHLHVGVWDAPYSATAIRGSLPQESCGGDPRFPAEFIDPKEIDYAPNR